MIRGKTFISTRPSGRSEKLRYMLREQGAGLMEMPMIDIRKARLSGGEMKHMENIEGFDWIVFTSSNGVDYFFDQLKNTSGSYRLGEKTRIAVIGKITGAGLKRFGHTAHYVGNISTGLIFSGELRKIFAGKNYKVLLPLGNLARKTIEEKIKDIAEVHRINVYNTGMPESIDYEVLQYIQDDNYDMIIFTSSSGFNNFRVIVKNSVNLNLLRIACIGSTTAEAVSGSGITPLVTGKTMNSSGIVQAIMDYYSYKI